GYSGSVARTVCLGEPSDTVARLWDAADAAHRSLAGLIRPGATSAELARGGHAMVNAGLAVAGPLLKGWDNKIERPVVGLPGTGWHDDDVALGDHQLVVAGPNPTTPDGRLGVFVADAYLTTRDGAQRLGRMPTELIVTDKGAIA